MNKDFGFLIFSFFFIFCGISSCRMVSPTHTEGKVVLLDKKHLAAIPAEVYEDTTITTLSLFGNQISAISDSIGNLKHLKVLYLGKNQLTKFPTSICQLSQLQILSLAYNALDSIPDDIGKLTNLEWLIVGNNQLVHLSDSIRNCSKLTQLNCSRNKLEQLPVGIFKLTNLQVINLNYNQLDSIQCALIDLKKLKELRLYKAGDLLQIPESICQLRWLELLQLDQNTVVPTCVLALKTNRLQLQYSEW